MSFTDRWSDTCKNGNQGDLTSKGRIVNRDYNPDSMRFGMKTSSAYRPCVFNTPQTMNNISAYQSKTNQFNSTSYQNQSNPSFQFPANNPPVMQALMVNSSSYQNQSNPLFQFPANVPSEREMYTFMINSSSYQPPMNIKAFEPPAVFQSSHILLNTNSTSLPTSTNSNTNTNTNPIIYSNRGENIDLCVSCYSKSSDILKNKLMLSPGYKRSGSDYYWCDVCKANIFVGDGPETKLQVLLKLKDLNLSVEKLLSSCQSNPWNNRIDALYSELIVGGMTESMAREICQKLV